METNKNILTKMLRMAAFLMATPLLFTACGSDDDDAPVPPTVQAAAVADAATMHSLAFEVSNISGADSVKYVFGKDVAGSTPETVGKNGTKLASLAGTQRLDFDNLDEATEYSLVVVAYGKKNLTVTANAKATTAAYTGTTFTAVAGERYSRKNTTVTLTGKDGETLVIDCNYPSANFLPAGTYTVDATEEAEYNIAPRYSSYSCKDASGNVAKHNITAGTVKIELDKATKTYNVDADITVDGLQTNLLGRFSGQIEGFEVFDARQLNPVSAKILEIDADKAVEGEVYVKMNDADWNAELGFMFICSKGAKELEEGTYDVATTNAKGTLGTGTYISDYIYSDAEVDIAGTPVSGKAEVKKDGKTYTITYDFVMKSGQRYVGTFKGEIKGY